MCVVGMLKVNVCTCVGIKMFTCIDIFQAFTMKQTMLSIASGRVKNHKQSYESAGIHSPLMNKDLGRKQRHIPQYYRPLTHTCMGRKPIYIR